MTADVDLARLLGAVGRAGAKLIVVGDDRQLDAIGPGGALTALTALTPTGYGRSATTDRGDDRRPGRLGLPSRR
jgi:hypothetical protein